ncbi:MAG: hypothetical protein IH606_06770 [Burkholderiales bacterium]|nr:hypothetical protein [Burkholderiales bacterium]
MTIAAEGWIRVIPSRAHRHARERLVRLREVRDQVRTLLPVRELGERAGCPGLGVIFAVAATLDRLQQTRLAVLTPYNEDLTRSVAAAVPTGREIVCAYGMGIEDNIALADPTPAEIVAFASERLAGRAFDGIFVSCTNFRAYEARAALSEEFGVPVVTSNSAVIDAIQRFRDASLSRCATLRTAQGSMAI